MKKLVFAVATFATLTFAASCGGNKTSDANAEADSAMVDSTADEAAAANLTPEEQAAAQAADEVTAQLDQALSQENADPAKVKESVAAIQKKVEELQAAGDTKAAAAYASKVQAYLNENAEKLKSIDPQSVTVASLVSSVVNAPETAKSAAQSAKEAVEGDAAAVKAAAQKAGDAVKAAPEAAKAAAKAKATEATNAAVNKANQKASEAVEKANKKANEAVQKGADKAAKAIGKSLGL